MPYTFNGQNSTFDAGYYASTGLRLYKDGINGRTYYIYDGDEPVEELDSNGNLIATNVYGPTGLMARYYTSDEGISNAGGQSLMGNTVYYTYDPQGNVVQRLVTPDVLGDEGDGGQYDYPLPWPLMPLDTEYYDAFGAQHWDIDRATGEQEGYQDPFGYGAQWGYYTDNETGLVLMGHRYYAYGNGHFLTRDPIGTAGGINLYGFVGNNPVNERDPNGTDPSMTGQMKEQEQIALDQLDGMTPRQIRRQLLEEEGIPEILHNLNVAAKILKPGAEAAPWVIGAIGVMMGEFEGAGAVSSASSAIDESVEAAGAAAGKEAAQQYSNGEFSIWDWNGYPKGVPKPTGPFRLLTGSEYETARTSANAANRAWHDALPELEGLDIHEIQPIKFNGDPINPFNKVFYPRRVHAPITAWWRQLQINIEPWTP